jgi:8-oxo-dGTP diphosphatase
MVTTSREYPERPIVGVGGVTIQDGRVLLIRRAFPPLQGEWSIPGGGLDVGETIVEGVRRELMEETGIAVRVLEHIETLERIVYDEQERVRYHFVIIDYLCEALGGELRSGSDVTDAAWVSRDDLPPYKVREAATRVILRAFEMANARAK